LPSSHDGAAYTQRPIPFGTVEFALQPAPSKKMRSKSDTPSHSLAHAPRPCRKVQTSALGRLGGLTGVVRQPQRRQRPHREAFGGRDPIEVTNHETAHPDDPGPLEDTDGSNSSIALRESLRHLAEHRGFECCYVSHVLAPRPSSIFVERFATPCQCIIRRWRHWG
jgi:hypothetical protein